MSYSYQISEKIDISVCPVDGISIDTIINGQYHSVPLSKLEALRLCSAIIYAYKTGYVMNDDGDPIDPLTEEEIQSVINNRFDPYDAE